jgi:hypothetical protein
MDIKESHDLWLMSSRGFDQEEEECPRQHGESFLQKKRLNIL